jgi:hypothetical protein
MTLYLPIVKSEALAVFLLFAVAYTVVRIIVRILEALPG